MNKRERREKYLSTRRPPEFFQRREEWKKLDEKIRQVMSTCEGKTEQERLEILINAGLVSPECTVSTIPRIWL